MEKKKISRVRFAPPPPSGCHPAWPLRTSYCSRSSRLTLPSHLTPHRCVLPLRLTPHRRVLPSRLLPRGRCPAVDLPGGCPAWPPHAPYRDLPWYLSRPIVPYRDPKAPLSAAICLSARLLSPCSICLSAAICLSAYRDLPICLATVICLSAYLLLTVGLSACLLLSAYLPIAIFCYLPGGHRAAIARLLSPCSAHALSSSAAAPRCLAAVALPCYC